VDGTGLGRPYAPHRSATAARRQAQGSRSVSFWDFVSIVGGLYLATTVNGLSALLALSTLLSYLLIYTPLKRKTPLCTLLGAFPAPLPTLIGCAGAAARIEPQAWLLFAILFLWQFPHFLAIALMYRDDYERAGYRMLPGLIRIRVLREPRSSDSPLSW
jgi:heme o synthase